MEVVYRRCSGNGSIWACVLMEEEGPKKQVSGKVVL
jgi:hypothetical protein